MTSPDDELVTRVADAIGDVMPDHSSGQLVRAARAAIAVVLEEAAKVADREAAILQEVSFSTGKLPENFADVNKWRCIATQIRALNPKEQ